jgi:heme/copper-type cytochrome/quinol oxidase subunit 2
MMAKGRLVVTSLALLLALQPHLVRACAACYGQSDAPMARGMNWGIMSLLAIIGLVLMGVAGFFVYLTRRAAAVQSAGLSGVISQATESV